MSSRDPWLLEGRHCRLCMQPCVCGPRGSHGEAARAGSRDETEAAKCQVFQAGVASPRAELPGQCDVKLWKQNGKW